MPAQGVLVFTPFTITEQKSGFSEHGVIDELSKTPTVPAGAPGTWTFVLILAMLLKKRADGAP